MIHTKRAKSIMASLLTILSCTACGGKTDEKQDAILEKLPAKTWEGGKATLSINVESSLPALLKMEFNDPDEKSGRKIVVHQKLAEGNSSLSINLKDHTGGYFEVGVPEAKPGAKLSCSLSLDGKEFWSQSSTLEKPLAENEAFFVNSDFDDFTKGEESDD